MARMRVLHLCHNHPSLHPGGTEILAHDLFCEMKRDSRIEALFLACTNHVHRDRHPGTCFQTIGPSADEIILWAGHFDRFYQSQIDLHGIVPELTDLLVSFNPHVVHVHHLLLLGAEMLFLIRRVLPRARIVFTLHDYYPICAHDGQMVTTRSHELCRAASPDACHACFPERTPDKFVLREKHLKNLLSTVDLFVAPSAFLRERYLAWGLPKEKLVTIRNGRPPAGRPDAPEPATGRKAVFGYFGNLNPFKGVLVALQAVQRLAAAGEERFSLAIHGGMPFQTEAFRKEVAETAATLSPWVVQRGLYDRTEMPELLAAVDWVIVPSIWWENAPLVILEAFQQQRPVICSGIGGMAELVRHEVDGLHVRPGDPQNLMQAMRRALDEPGLWHRLAANIPAVPTIACCAKAYRDAYLSLLTVPEPVPA